MKRLIIGFDTEYQRYADEDTLTLNNEVLSYPFTLEELKAAEASQEVLIAGLFYAHLTRASIIAKTLNIPDLRRAWRQVLQVKALQLINARPCILGKPIDVHLAV